MPKNEKYKKVCKQVKQCVKSIHNQCLLQLKNNKTYQNQNKLIDRKIHFRTKKAVNIDGL